MSSANQYKNDAGSKLRKLTEMNFLQDVRADWLVPPLAMLCLALLVYFFAQ